MFCLVNILLLRSGSLKSSGVIIQGEYFVTHRFPDFFKIQKLFSSAVQGS